MHKHFENIKLTHLPNSMAEITGELSLEFLNVCRKDAIKALNDRADIPGFRKGFIPEDILVKRLGEMNILEETAEVALGREYENILKEAGKDKKLLTIGRPSIAITKMAPSVPLEFKMRITILPEFTLPDYKALTLGVMKRPDDTEVTQKEMREKKRILVMEELVKETKIDLPELLIASELEKMMGQFKDDVVRFGKKFDEYLKEIKKTEGEVKKEWRESAVKRVKSELIVGKIAEEEKIEASSEELEKETKHLLSHYPDADPLRARVYVYEMLRNQKVLEFLEAIDKGGPTA